MLGDGVNSLLCAPANNIAPLMLLLLLLLLLLMLLSLLFLLLLMIMMTLMDALFVTHNGAFDGI